MSRLIPRLGIAYFPLVRPITREPATLIMHTMQHTLVRLGGTWVRRFGSNVLKGTRKLARNIAREKKASGRANE